MTELLINLLLIIGLNLPVYLELYKHMLSNRKIIPKIIFTVVYWIAAYETQTIAALAGIIYLYYTYYKSLAANDSIRNINLWEINKKDIFLVAFQSIWARIVILFVNFLYVVVIDKLLKYDIKPQDIIIYYTQSEWWFKLILAFEIVIIAPIVEEFAFRFFLYDKILADKMPKFMAALISAGIFALVHFNISGIPTFLGLGLFCALMYEKKGYWGAVIAHGISNGFTLFFL